MDAGGNMFETELYANLFRGTMLVELDRVGVFQDLEVGKQDLPDSLQRVEGGNDRWHVEIPVEERRRRLQTLLEALNLLWGGGRTARLRTGTTSWRSSPSETRSASSTAIGSACSSGWSRASSATRRTSARR